MKISGTLAPHLLTSLFVPDDRGSDVFREGRVLPEGRAGEEFHQAGYEQAGPAQVGGEKSPPSHGHHQVATS
jgi:hypothetical protein